MDLFMLVSTCRPVLIFFFFNDTATTEIYTLSLHDALPIWEIWLPGKTGRVNNAELFALLPSLKIGGQLRLRSEEHTSELQSQSNLVCRLLLEKKNLVNPMIIYDLNMDVAVMIVNVPLSWCD